MKKFLVTAFAVAFLAAWVVPSVAGVDFSGQYRVRGEIKNPSNFTDHVSGSADGAEKSDLIEQRVRLTGVANPTSDVTVKVTIQDTRKWGHNTHTTGGPSLTDKASNVLDLHESYVLVNDFLGLPVDLKVGRQELVYGDQRLVGSFGWSNNGRSFDAIKLTHKTDQFNLDLFFAKIDEGDTDTTGTTYSANGSDSDQDFYGLYATVNVNANNTLDAYLLYLRDAGTTPMLTHPDAPAVIIGSQELYTIGARLKGKLPMANPIDYTVELPYQFGSINGQASTLAGPDQDADIKAWAFAAKAGITVNGGNTRIGGEYDYATGDDRDTTAAGSTRDGDIETFTPLFPTQHGHYGMMDQNGWRNMNAWSINASHKVNPKLKVSAAYWSFEKAEGTDDRYTAGHWLSDGIDDNGTGTLTKNDDKIGSEIDLQAAYKYNSNVVIKAGYGHFFTDDVIEKARKASATARDNSDDMDYGYLMLVANF